MKRIRRISIWGLKINQGSGNKKIYDLGTYNNKDLEVLKKNLSTSGIYKIIFSYTEKYAIKLIKYVVEIEK